MTSGVTGGEIISTIGNFAVDELCVGGVTEWFPGCSCRAGLARPLVSRRCGLSTEANNSAMSAFGLLLPAWRLLL